jgi:hypothetical protein
MMSQWTQGLIIAAAVMWSVLHLLRKYFPRQIGRVRMRCAAALQAPSQPRVVQGIGVWLQANDANDEDCSSGCGGCSGCASNPQTQKQEQHPLTFHRRL